MSILEVENLTKTFGTFVAVSNLSFKVEKNSVMGFLGPNGAGKTTTIRMLVGLSKKDSGNIFIEGNQLAFGDSTINKDIGYLPEQPAIYPWYTAFEYLNLIADLYQISEKKSEKVNEMLKRVGLYEVRNKKVGTYSNGMKQRLGIAQAVINKPKLLIMDEPVSALDPIGRREILELIKELKQEMAIIFSTHILSDVDKVCDHVTLINKGIKIISAPLSELKGKYSSGIITIEFKSINALQVNAIKQQAWIKKLTVSGDSMRIWLKDQSILENNFVLKYLLSFKLNIVKYGLDLPETEDLFMDLIEGQE